MPETLIIVCPHCHTPNRVPADKPGAIGAPTPAGKP